MQHWYVFDRYDCFGRYDHAAVAAEQAQWMVDTLHLEGVHIHHFTEEEFKSYLKKPVD